MRTSRPYSSHQVRSSDFFRPLTLVCCDVELLLSGDQEVVVLDISTAADRPVRIHGVAFNSTPGLLIIDGGPVTVDLNDALKPLPFSHSAVSIDAVVTSLRIPVPVMAAADSDLDHNVWAAVQRTVVHAFFTDMRVACCFD